MHLHCKPPQNSTFYLKYSAAIVVIVFSFSHSTYGM